ncbi:hypothetical protein [Stratiformator vulcanicus]|nr:hypothetical protein [Stratiformator vulcanicus]
MALLIMGIGVVSVATLFPLSLMRSVHATKMTNATILRYNAETWIKMQDMEPLRDPDGDGTDFNEPSDRFIIDPMGAVRLGLDVSNLDGDGADGDGAAPDEFFPFGTLIDRHAFVLSTADVFDGVNAAEEQAASSTVTLPDSFVDAFETQFQRVTGAPTAAENTTLNPVSLTDHRLIFKTVDGIADYGTDLRITVFNGNGSRAVSRTVTNIATDTPSAGNTEVTLNAPLPYPLVFDADGDTTIDVTDVAEVDLGEIRVELPERRYTWMLSVRRNTLSSGSETANVDVVTYFRRPYGNELWDEKPYAYIEGATTNDPFYVAYDPATENRPSVKRGYYFCNLNELRWYQIGDFVREFDNTGDLNGDGDTDFDLPATARVLEFKLTPSSIIPTEPGRVTGRFDFDDPKDGISTADNEYPLAVFPRNVVEVYPLSTLSIAP